MCGCGWCDAILAVWECLCEIVGQFIINITKMSLCQNHQAVYTLAHKAFTPDKYGCSSISLPADQVS